MPAALHSSGLVWFARSQVAPVLLVSALLSLALTGCGGGLVAVEGTVTLDGQPLAGADVAFHPQAGGRLVTGKTDAQGRFTLTTLKPGDGAAAGEYAVTVDAKTVTFEAGNSTGEGYSEKIAWRAPQKYSRKETSGLSVTLSAAASKPVLALQSAP